MAKKTNQSINTEEIDPELERLKKKSAEGAMNIFGDLLDNPEIKKAIMHKLAMPLLAVVMLFVGALGLLDVAKQLLGLNWEVEIIVSLILWTIGLSYVLKNMCNGEKHD